MITMAFTTVSQLYRRYNYEGKLNPNWPGIEAVRKAVIDHIQKGLNHFFNIDHKHCTHDGSPHIRSGHYVTCKEIQKVIKDLIWRVLELDVDVKTSKLWNDEVGLSITNAGESAIGNIAQTRKKAAKYSAYENRWKVMLGAIMVQVLRLALYTNELILPEEELMKDVEQEFDFPSGSLISEYQREKWTKRWTKKVKQARKERTPDWKANHRATSAARREKKRTSKKVTVVGGGYDNEHTGHLEQKSDNNVTKMMKEEAEAVAERMTSMIEQGRTAFQDKNYIVPQKNKRAPTKCSVCKALGHNKRTCEIHKARELTRLIEKKKKDEKEEEVVHVPVAKRAKNM